MIYITMKQSDLEKEFLTDVIPVKTNRETKKKINSKQKGSSNERATAKLLTSRFPDHPFSRTFGSGAFVGQSNRFRAENMTFDQKLMVVSDIHSDESFKFSIEHKAYADNATLWDLFNESSDLNKFIVQCQSDADFIERQPMLIVKYNKHKHIVFIHEKPFEPVFSWKGWNCYWLEELLKQPDSFFFS